MSLTSPALAGGFFTTSPTWEAHESVDLILKHPAFWWHPLHTTPRSQVLKPRVWGCEPLDFHLRLSMSPVSQGTQEDDTPGTLTLGQPQHTVGAQET